VCVCVGSGGARGTLFTMVDYRYMYVYVYAYVYILIYQYLNRYI